MRFPFVTLLVAACGVSFAAAEHDPEMQELVDWFVGRDKTVFNNKMDIRRENPTDPESMLGVFANKDIKKGEVLLSIPWESTINSGYTVTEPDPLSCDTVRNLVAEARKGDASEFAPYVKYVMSQKKGQIASAWSIAGQRLLNEVLGGGELPPLSAFDWLADDWYDECEGERDEISKHAAMQVVQRAEDDLLLPIYDMFAHRNGRYHNILNNRVEGVKFDITASRDIKKGEQLYNSYNQCATCGGRANSYGTPDIFRDYGFVEEYPQRWIFSDRAFAFDVREKKPVLIKTGDEAPPTEDDLMVLFSKGAVMSEETVTWLRHEIARLERLKKLYDDAKVDPYELQMIWDYADTFLNAARLAIKYNKNQYNDTLCENGGRKNADGTCSLSDGYDALEDEKDDLYFDDNTLAYFKPVTCDNEEIMMFQNYDEIESPKSIYQQLNFMERKEIDDMCFDLDDIVQICSIYRPHYHEYNMDFAARYLEDVKRVVFVGGGDSMLLYETLKYPNIEKVIGLELDQKVVRKSFKYFHTQPHFDDDRVEWWFGDATKSVMMLPRDYFESFDLVLIDLSETVMSLSVNKRLDVFGALALLLSPDGVMIKNELYLEKFAELFDYTAQIYIPDVPIICDQVVVMGSNKVDFLNDERFDHQVGTKLIEPIGNHPHERFHDYRRTSALEQGKCDQEIEDSGEFVGRSGIMMVTDVENVTVPLTPLRNTVAFLTTVLKNQGMHPLSTGAMPDDVDPDDTDATIIFMEEGYVNVRVFPEEKYCALDIHLWASFNQIEEVKDAMVQALGAGNSRLNSYRLVTGGMQGTKTWDEDHKTIGARLRQTRNCDGIDYAKDGDMIQPTVELVTEESLNLIQSDSVFAVVLCGDNEESCKLSDTVAKHSKIQKVEKITTCPELTGASEFSEDIADIMLKCEKSVIKALEKIADAAPKKEIGTFIVDPSASLPMVKIATSIWTSRNRLDQLLSDKFTFFSFMPDNRDLWRPKHNFLDRVRKKISWDPLFTAEFVVTGANGMMEVGVLQGEDTEFFMHLDDAIDAIKKRSDLNIVVRKVQGSLVKKQENFDPKNFVVDDYDNEDAINQFATQKSLGRQSVFQLNVEGKDAEAPTKAIVKKALEEAILKIDYITTESAKMVSDGIGNGAVVSATMTEGNVVVIWDGDKHIDINLFTFDETEKKATDFLNFFIEGVPGLKLALRDEQPRGTGRVVNFNEDKSRVEHNNQKKLAGTIAKNQQRPERV